MIRLSAAYSKKVGLPGYSSHSFSVSIETELQNLDNVREESARLYDSLQQAVDQQIQKTGFVPPDEQERRWKEFKMPRPESKRSNQSMKPTAPSRNKFSVSLPRHPAVAYLILVSSMTRLSRNTVEAVVLVLVGVALIAASLLSYRGHPVGDCNLYSPSVPGWIAVVLFLLIGIAGRLIHLHDQRRARKRDVDTPPKT